MSRLYPNNLEEGKNKGTEVNVKGNWKGLASTYSLKKPRHTENVPLKLCENHGCVQNLSLTRVVFRALKETCPIGFRETTSPCFQI